MKILFFVILIFLFLGIHSTYAAFNQQINYQGRLLDSVGDAIADGNYDIDFALYTASVGGLPVWTETQTVTTMDGLFSVMLGSVSPISDIDFNQTLYLGIDVESDGEMSPRKIIGAVPSAFEADKLDGVSSEQFFRNDIANSTSSANTFFTLVQEGAGKVMELFGSGMTSLFTVFSSGEVRFPFFTATSTTATSTIAGNLEVQNTLQVGTDALYLTDNNITSTGNLSINSNGTLFNLPTSQGGAGYVLQNDGSGNLNWVATSTLGIASTVSGGDSYTNVLSNVWTENSKTLPANLAMSQVVVIGDYVYFFGGQTTGAALTNVIYRAPVTDPTNWSNTGSTLPGVLGYSQAVVIGDYVYLFGGYSTAASSVIYRAPVSDPTNWSNTGSTLPGNLYASQSAVIGDYVYLFGGQGTSGTVTNVIYRAPVTDPTNWSNTGSTIPGTLARSQIVVIGDYVYLLGGTPNASNVVNVIYRAPVTDPTNWSNTGSTLPAGMQYSQVVVIGDYVYLLGGFTTAASSGIFRAPVSSPTTWSYTGQNLTEGKYGAQAAIIGDYVYLFGGFDSVSYTTSISSSHITSRTTSDANITSHGGMENTQSWKYLPNGSSAIGGGSGIADIGGLITVGSGLNLFGSGTSANPYEINIAAPSSTVAFRVNRSGSGNQAVTNSVGTVLNFTNDSTGNAFNIGNNFDLSTDRFTPTVAGTYTFSANVGCVNSSNVCQVYITKNGTPVSYSAYGSAGAGAQSLTTLVSMNGTTDYVQAAVYMNGTLVEGTDSYTNFSGALIAPLSNEGGTFDQDEDYALTGEWDFTNATVLGLGGGSGSGDKHTIIVDEKTSGTQSGTFTSGAWRTRDLNTEVVDEIGITISSNEFTLPAGTYKINASAPGYAVNRHRSRLYNVTDATVTAYGTSAFARIATSELHVNRSEISTVLTISSPKTFRIEHYAETTKDTNGFGVPTSFSGVPEIYSVVNITQLGGGESLFTQVGSDAYFNDGNIGIGTSSPQRLLHVYRSDDGPPVRFQDSNGYCEINPTSTTWTCTSDENLKENIFAIASTTPDLYDKMRLLRPVTFEWKTDESNTTRVGLIAQEVEAIFPEFVITDSETGLKSVSYGSFIPYILTMLQHIADRLDELVGDALHFAGGIITKLTIGSSEDPVGITMFDEMTGDAYCLTIKNGNVHTQFGECLFEDEEANLDPEIYSKNIEDDNEQEIIFDDESDESVETSVDVVTGDSTTTPEFSEEDEEVVNASSSEATVEPETPGESETPASTDTSGEVEVTDESATTIEPEVVEETETPEEPETPAEPETPEEPEEVVSDVIVETNSSSGSVEISL